MDNYSMLRYPFCLFFLVIAQIGFSQQKPVPPQPNFKVYTQKIATSTPTIQSNPLLPKQKNQTLAGACAPDTIILLNQDDIDNFADNYPECHSFKNLFIKGGDADPAITNLDGLAQVEEITEMLMVDSTNIQSLSGLSGLARVGIYFLITNNFDLEETGLTGLESLGVVFFSNLPKLTTLAGLTDNFTNHGTFTLIINGTKLTDLTGLEGIHTVPNMYISGNPELTSLSGLDNLTYSGGGISISANVKLTDISALSGITELQDGPLELSYNYELNALTGLENIELIKKHLRLEWNIALETLDALNDNLVIEDEDSEKLIIKDNWNLAFCSEPAICNFLQSGGGYEISGNAPGCQDFEEIDAACLVGCTIGEHFIFTGDDNDEWDNAANWDLGRVPLSCDSVEIPDGKYVTLGNDITVGWLITSSAEIEANGYSITAKNGATMDWTNFYSLKSLNIGGLQETSVTNCEINGNVTLGNISQELTFSGNYIYSTSDVPGNLSISDRTERSGNLTIEDNSVSGDFSLQINTNDPNAETLVAYDYDMYVYGSVSLKARNRGGNFQIGKYFQGWFHVGRDLSLDAEETDYPNLEKIQFIGSENSNLYKLGSAGLSLYEFQANKDWNGVQIIPHDDLTIRKHASFSAGLVKPVEGKMVVFEKEAFIAQYSSASWVSGKVRKIGSSPFTFPVGNDNHQGVIKMAPISIPGQDPLADEPVFEALYFEADPTGAGYDTAQRQGGLQKVSGKEYWWLKQVDGTPLSEYQVTLRYDSMVSQKTPLNIDLRVAAWHNNQWYNRGVETITGNNAEAYITSTSLTELDTVYTLGYIPSRLPVVTIGTLPPSLCRGQQFKVPVGLDTTMVGGNTFQVHLSQANGDFSSFYIIGQKANVVESDTIIATIPVGFSAGSGYKLRVVGLSPPLNSTNSPSVEVKSVPQLPITVIGPNKVCLNTGASKYYVQTPEAGATYTWSISFGAGTFVPMGDTVLVTWTNTGTGRVVSTTSQNNCGTGQTGQKNNIQVVPAPPVSSPVITPSGRWLFASQHVPPQAGISIRWMRDGNTIPGAINYSYYAGLGGAYTAQFFNDCLEGPLSNQIIFAANAVPQSITFSPIPNKAYGDLPFELNASSSSGLPVEFEIINGPGSLIGKTYNITGLGTVTIRAMQPGNDVYDTAQYVTQTFQVSKAQQLIVFDPIADKPYGSGTFTISPVASSGLPCQVSVVSGPATISGNVVTLTGAGTVTIRAIQEGNGNFNPASPVDRSFCATPGNLGGISGPISVCPTQPIAYTTKLVPNATYTWKMAGGATLPSTTHSVSVTWPSPGNYALTVSATGPCGTPSPTDTLNVVAITSLEPDSVSNMLPDNGASNLKLPINLSWVPRHPGLQYYYDLYIWPANETQPSTPFVANLSTVNYVLTINSGLAANTTYKWMVVAWNGSCTRINTGPVQQFTLAPLADLQVTNVTAPVAAFSGQQMSIQWTVKNNGPAPTLLNESWSDAIFLSFDSIPFFQQVSVNPGAWSSLDFPVRPLLIATRPNVSALDAGASYTNNISFTIPANYNWPVYAYVITNYNSGPQAPRQWDYANDTARADNPIQINLSPAPDLRVDSVTAPSPVFSGNTIGIRYKVKNYGATISGSPTWTDKVYISQSPFFNLATATLLKQPKSNGTYYSTVGGGETPKTDVYHNFAPEAAYTQQGPLENDSGYVRDVQVVIPNFISGTYYLFVVTDFNGNIYEGPAETNNTASALTAIVLTATPQLIVADLTVPFTSVSTTQPFGINWTVKNEGSNDNRQRNAGHYLKLTTQSCATPNSLLVQALDSIGYGNSWWIDRVYLSPNPSGLNVNTDRLLYTYNNGSIHYYNLDLINIFTTIPGAIGNCVPPYTNPVQYSQNTGHVLNPGAVFPAQYSFAMPADLLPGTYYLYVATNADSAIFESPYSLKWKRSAALTVTRPDLTVSSVTLPANAIGGQQIAIGYTIENTGSGSVFNSARKDEIFVSPSPVFDASAQKIATFSFTESIAAGASLTKSFNYTFGAEAPGTRYFFVKTNVDSASFKETNYTNNQGSSSLSYSPGTASDLIVSQVNVPDSAFSVFGAPLKYTVTNNGSGTTYGSWVDSVFISCNAVFNRSTSFFIALRPQEKSVVSGASYSDSFLVYPPLTHTLHSCFTGIDVDDVYFHVIANSNQSAFESSYANNKGASGLRKLINPNVDHIITGITMPDVITAGRSFTGSWNVKNLGYNPGQKYYSFWYDTWYLVVDSAAPGNKVKIFDSYGNNVLNRNQSFTYQRQVSVPNITAGEYYVMVVTNSSHQIPGEKNTGNNAMFVRGADGRAKKIQVQAPVEADITGILGSYQPVINAGQILQLPLTITNHGPGDATPAYYNNYVWLSTDFVPGNQGDVLLGNFNPGSVLQPGQSANTTLQLNIPNYISQGNYILIFHTNADGLVYEANFGNNLAYGYLAISTPPLTDLMVSNLQSADTALLGYPFNLKWNVQNLSPSSAIGLGTDGIYLTTHETTDSAVLQGTLQHSFNLAALGVDSFTNSPVIQGVTEGNYNLLVRTDILNNFNDPARGNNTGKRGQKVYVGVKELVLNQEESNNLGTQALYYKLIVADSLEGATLLFTLKTPDSLAAVNQVFAGHQFIPSPANFDFAFETPNAGNQTMMMPSVKAGAYYIYIRTTTPNRPVQALKMKVEVLPFAIVRVDANSGGNTGNVTIKITGSLYTPDVVARLKGGTTITASQIYFTNSNQVFATFNLRGAPLGLYDVELYKPANNTTALLEDGFRVENTNNGGLITGPGNNTGQNGTGNEPGCDPGAQSGLNAQLVVNVVIPPNVFGGWPFVIQINYTNPTNVDIPVQTRVVYNEEGLPLALNPAALDGAGTSSLYIELGETNGPPGFIRAGGSGTINVYCKAPADYPGHSIIHFKLK